jgi:hypothetical protein
MTTKDTFPNHPFIAPDPDTFDIEAWISGATRPETVITLSSKGHECGEFAALELQLLAANKAAEDAPGDDRLVSVASAEPRRIAEQMAALAKVIDKGRRPFRFRGLPEYPVEGDPQPCLKAIREANKDADEDDANMTLLAACCVSPAMTPAQWAKIRGALGEGQFVQAIRAARQVTYEEAPSSVFSVAASVALQTQAS